jgi:NADPH-dependent curcumin reductase CurA
MRVDRNLIAFSAVAAGGTIADINFSDAESIAVLLEITAHGGTATTTFVDLIPRDGTTVTPVSAASDAIGHPADIAAATGMFAFSRIGAGGAAKTQFIGSGYWIPAVLKEGRLIATLTGAGHTITGNVHFFRRFE